MEKVSYIGMNPSMIIKLKMNGNLDTGNYYKLLYN